MSSSAAARPGAALVESAAQTVLHRGLREGKSAFTPDASVWTAEAADELDRFYVQRLDVGAGNFVQKLQGQLEGAMPSAVQLAAELLYLNALPLSNVSGKAKRARIDAVLSWLPEPVAIPTELDAALDTGVFSGGVGFNTMLWSQLVHLVAFVQTWWTLDDQSRDRALSDPWAWKAFVESVGGGNAPSQRNELKYLAFPATFEPIVNVSHRQRIRTAYKNLLPGPLGDIDRDLLTIRQRLQEQSPGVQVEFYGPPWAAAWRTGKSATVGRHAWLVRPATAGRPDTVLEWTSEGFIALPADRLRPLPAGTTLDTVRDAVSSDYSSTDYVRQSELADSFHAVLTAMKPNDILATATGEVLQLGIVGNDPPLFETVDGAVRLRRNATWRTTDNPLPIADLPAPLPTHLATPGAVVDLSQDLDLLLALMQEDTGLDEGEEDDVTPTTAEVVEGEQPTLKNATDALADNLHVGKDFLQECIDLLTDRQQMIFYGPPGTGKTYIAERLARFLADAGALESERVALVQFHPSTSYEDFVEGYRPGEGDSEGKLSFKLTPGPFSRLVSSAAGDLTRPYFLLIDEINRANLAKVFGELYYLLEYRDSGIRLLYRPGKPFTLPRNVFVIGTMNTADRSIALVDAAMRRRFAFVELHPDLDPVKSLLRRWLGKKDTERADLLDALNARIADREFKIGPSYLMKADAERTGGLDRVWKYSILPLLVEHHYGRLSPSQVEQKYGIAALRAELAPTSTKSTDPTSPVDASPPCDEP